MNGILWAGKIVPYYGIMITVGGALAFLLGKIIVKHFALSEDDLIITAAYAAGGGILGAKLFSLLLLWDQIKWNQLFNLEYVKQLFQGGYIFYGGLIGGLIFVALAGKIHKINTGKYVTAVIPCLPLAHGFGRIGCFLSGCCYGIPYNGIGCVVYHKPSFAPTEIPLFPVQLVEAFLNFALAIVLLLFVYKKAFSPWSVYLYLYSYAVIRFILEYFRYDVGERGFLWMFSTSQWISILIVIIVTFHVLRYRSIDGSY